ncbi:proline--tRNA ligase [Buchnera aphidicola (Hyadaphis tataricae)]|uniref:Proline--tRNA ligase n=1 Tax=Buchnera aphidicola (Hyadaphis tataricae) TaxID=1241859 RepID=A0A4D6XZH1_9GAMM|nr:proline--tRNA ligase [Buchnera aphidicola]QCI21549.1 proline--tRNA ligase [Buchnera aphidicola (Hyadaphis tataricae)]
MRTSKYLLSTVKETPDDAKIISHQLMIRSGMIRKISSGVYVWLPTGIRVIRKIKSIIKTEMNKIESLEISMPIIQPEYLWKKSGRLHAYGEELLKFSDRHKNQFILGPTNEEVVTDFIKTEIHSYKELPLIVYQIQTKFRDEIRPRFGVIRAREFIMKDAYSFHSDKQCLKNTYNKFYHSYINIFNKIKLNFSVVQADSGSMGGNISHEFQAFSKNGEDEVVFSKNGSYSSNINSAQCLETIDFLKNKNSISTTNKISTQKSIIHAKYLKKSSPNKIKTILVKTNINNINSIAAILLCEHHELNFFKIEKIKIFQKSIVLLNEEETIKFSGVSREFLGPIGLNIPIIVDISAYKMKNFTIGANLYNHFFINVNWNDVVILKVLDIRKVTKKDISPDGSGYLSIEKSIEIGHIFQLEKSYSKKMNASIALKNGNQENVYMGCYGIGISRIIATVIEQNHDSHGIIWPDSIAPFEVVILPINMNKYKEVEKFSNSLYQELKKQKIDVILDDRNLRPGVMFHQMDLIGIPHQIIISFTLINNKNVEYRDRKHKKTIFVNITKTVDFILNKLKKKQK